MNKIGRYLWNVAIWVDQGINVIFGFLFNLASSPLHRFGDPDETLSSVFAKNDDSGACGFCAFMCRVLDYFDPGHCRAHIEADEGNDAE